MFAEEDDKQDVDDGGQVGFVGCDERMGVGAGIVDGNEVEDEAELSVLSTET